jgi:hypothetical protein
VLTETWKVGSRWYDTTDMSIARRHWPFRYERIKSGNMGRATGTEGERGRKGGKEGGREGNTTCSNAPTMALASLKSA